MSSKRIRLDLSTTGTQEVPAYTGYPSTGMRPGSADVMEIPPATAPIQTPPLTLATISLEALALIACHLSARDILNLSQTASHFRRALSSIELYGSSLLQRSQDLCRYHHSYDENTQTLDLRQKHYKRGGTPREDFRTYLRSIEIFLLSHRIWARTHIRTLIIPLEKITIWKLTDRLGRIAAYLSGVTHLHLFLHPVSQHALNKRETDRLCENLVTLKAIPAYKVTIENCTLAKNLTGALLQAFGHGVFHYGVRQLSIAHSADREPCEYAVALPDNPACSQLDTLDCSLAHPGVLQIQQLPGTITCLRTSGTTSIQGHAPSIERLEIVGTQTDGINAIERFSLSQKALPALKALYIAPPSEPLYHQHILKALIRQALPDLSITFTALHIQYLDLLEKLLLHANIHLPGEITFESNSSADIQRFARLAEQGVFGHLTAIRHQTQSLLTPVSSFAAAMAAALQHEKLPRLQNLTFVYQYDPTISDKHGIPFPQSAEGRLYLLQDRTLFTLQDILKQPYPDYFLHYFTVFDADKTKLFETTYPDTAQRQKFLSDLRQKLAKVTQSHQSHMLQTCPATVWLLRLEKLYLELYNIYIWHLWHSDVPRPTVEALRRFFPPKFSESEPGKQVSATIQAFLLRKFADKTCTALGSALAKAGLTEYNMLMNDNGFSISFSR